MYSVYFSPVQTFERKKGRLSLRWMGDVEIDLRNIGAKKMENKRFGQIRMGICFEGSQG